MHCVAVIDKDGDSAYGVRFPGFPGCFSAADTFEEILPYAVEALSLFLENSAVVPPRGIEAAHHEVAENLIAKAATREICDLV